MPTLENPTEKTLAALRVSDPTAVQELFAGVRAQFDQEISRQTAGEAAYTSLKNAWLGRKSGVLTLIKENWLKSAPPSLRPAVGQCLNELKRLFPVQGLQ